MVDQLLDLILDPQALFVVNHSGGKDSQAMYLTIQHLVPKERMVIIHADLGRIEWHGIYEHIEATCDHEIFVVSNKNKTFFDMVEHRGRFPSPTTRQCTSDLKRNPINSKIVQLSNERGFTKIVNCMGLRAEESLNRANKPVFIHVPSLSNGKRQWFEWLPIHELLIEEVFRIIKAAGQQPHWVYSKGIRRLSCVFCIYSSEEDIRKAAVLRPDIAVEYIHWEEITGQTLLMPVNGKKRFIKDIINQQPICQ